MSTVDAAGYVAMGVFTVASAGAGGCGHGRVERHRHVVSGRQVSARRRDAGYLDGSHLGRRRGGVAVGRGHREAEALELRLRLRLCHAREDARD